MGEHGYRVGKPQSCPTKSSSIIAFKAKDSECKAIIVTCQRFGGRGLFSKCS
jgi:hypothetical protein